MEVQEFGLLVRRAAAAKGLSQGKLGYLLTEPDGPLFDAKQVGLIYQNKRRPTRKMVQRLIDILHPHLDPAEAWAAAGLLPPGVTADMLRRLDIVAAGELTNQSVSIPYDPDLGELARRLRPMAIAA